MGRALNNNSTWHQQLLFTCLCLLLAACSKEPARDSHRGDDLDYAKSKSGPPAISTAESELPKVHINTGEKRVSVNIEIAAKERTRTRGLMYRRHMAPNHGMLFIFGDQRLLTFWMKNTLIPLDMLFINEELTIVGIVERAEPRTLSPRTVGLDSRYVLEVNGGFCEKHGIKAGMKIEAEGVDMPAPGKPYRGDL